jgi:hypothetical protein
MQPTQDEMDEAMYEKQIQDYQDVQEEKAYHEWISKNQDLVVTEFLKVAKDDFDKYCRNFWKFAPKED